MVVIFSNLSFMDFYRKIAPIYQVLGISPIFRPPSSKTETQSLHWTSTGFFGLILILYWSGIVASFVRQDLPNSTLSIISNNIQLLLNALALTTVIGNMLMKHRTYHRILDKFDSIDRQLLAIKQSVDYNGHVKLFYKLTVGFFVVLVYNYAFHLYVNLVRKQLQSVLYWILHSLPLFIYAFALHQVAIFLYFCHCRLRIIKDLLDLAREEDEDQDSVVVQLIPGSQSSLRCTDYFDKVAMKKSRQIITDILGLCENINDFYGPVLLTTLFSLFAVTSVQSFHCYVICADFDEESNRSVFTLFTCINLILINLSLVTFLVWASETVSKEATAIQLSVLKVKHISTITDSATYLHSVLSRIQFTALGFFNINYNTLFGFCSALITYLVLLIQFHSIYEEENLPVSTQQDNLKPLVLLADVEDEVQTSVSQIRG